MTPALVAVLAAYGVHLLLTPGRASVVGSDEPGDREAGSPHLVERVEGWLTAAGLGDVRARDLVLATMAVWVLGAALTLLAFGAVLPAVLAGALAAGLPLGALRQRRRSRRAAAHDAWPKLVEDIRILTGSVGRSIPRALFEAADALPDELRPAFDAARREWALSTDFAATIDVLERQLASPVADATCETLLIAHELGGADLDRRLRALAVDRRIELHHRKDARARQAGVRFARRFVLVVPLGMALAGMSVGDGRSAYRTPVGQLAVVAALATITGCWLWAGRLLRLPEEERAFRR